METLERPDEVWAEEFKYGLSTEDRIFMHTLFSLTDTHINIEILEECFTKRIRNNSQTDRTVNQFLECKRRLTNSLIKIIDINDNEVVGVLNPSINDYIKHSVYENKVTIESIFKDAIYIEQLEKLLTDSKSIIKALVCNGEITKYKSIDNKFYSYIVWIVVQEGILKEEYKELLIKGLEFIESPQRIFDEKFKKISILTKMLESKELTDFYGIKEALKDYKFRRSLISDLDIDDVIEFVELLKKLELWEEELYEEIVESLLDKVADYVGALDVFEFIEDKDYEDIQDLLFGGIANEYDKAFEKLTEAVRERIQEELLLSIDSLNIDSIDNKLDRIIKEYVPIDEIESIVRNHLQPEPDEDYYRERGHDTDSINAVDIIFDREIF